MKKVCAALAALALATPALGKKVAGVEFPETLSAAGAELKLNGAGIRKKFIIKVYAGGLYLAQPSGDAAAIVEADAPKLVRMVFLRDVDKGRILETYREGFEANSGGAALAGLLQKLDRIGPALADMKSGGEMSVAYEPGKGTTVTATGGGSATIEGKDFADAMFRLWLGAKPADEGLKDAFLGK